MTKKLTALNCDSALNCLEALKIIAEDIVDNVVDKVKNIVANKPQIIKCTEIKKKNGETIKLKNEKTKHLWKNRKNTPINLIVLHHTEGGGVKGSIHWLYIGKSSHGKKLISGIHYWIERDGTIFQTMEDEYWSHHCSAGTNVHKRSISIELANWGHRNVKGNHPKYTHTTSWRGAKSFEEYDEKQVKATIELLNYLCEKYRIPKTIPADFCPEKAISRKLWDKYGIMCHTHFKSDFKWDLHPHIEEYKDWFTEAGFEFVGKLKNKNKDSVRK